MEMLRVYLSPDGTNTEQVKQYLKKTKYLGKLIRSGHLDANESWTALTAVAIKSIEYGLPALTMSEDECTKIMWPLLQGYLPKSGLHRKYPRDVLYGKVDLHGLGLKNIFLSQGISHICDIIQHTWHKSITGHLIQQSLEQLRLEIGITGPLLMMDYRRHKPLILTQSWVQWTWKFMSNYNLKVNIDIAQPPLQRHNDVYLMEAILNLGQVTEKQLKWINQV